jgi:hypothetical protein
MDNETHSIKSKVLGDIQSGAVLMRPKFFFTLHFLVTIGSAAAIIFITVGILNFIAFSIRINSQETLLNFGPHGWEAFIRFFPWVWLGIDILLIAALQAMLRRFRFGYAVPVIYLAAGILLSAAAVAIILDRATPLNDRLYDRHSRLPHPLDEFYEFAHRPPGSGSGVCRCTIVAIVGNILTVEGRRGTDATSTLRVVVPQDNSRATTTGLSVGDTVFIAGEEDDGVIHAFGIQRDWRHDAYRH